MKINLKKLISTQDVSNMINKNQKKIFFTKNTIITPAAQELADKNGLQFIENNIKEFDDSELLSAFTQLLKKPALLEKIVESLNNKEILQTIDSSGLKIIKTSPSQYNKKIKILQKKDFDIEVGVMLLIDNYVEINEQKSLKIILSGEIEINVDNNCYQLVQQDIIILPKHVKLEWKSSKEAKILYIE